MSLRDSIHIEVAKINVTIALRLLELHELLFTFYLHSGLMLSNILNPNFAVLDLSYVNYYCSHEYTDRTKVYIQDKLHLY